MEHDDPVRRTILITGVGGPAGKAATAFFRRRGFHVHGTDIVPVRVDVDTFSVVPGGRDPSFGQAIVGLVRKDPPLLFLCTVTEEIPAAAAIKEELRSLGVSVFSTEEEMAIIANDKYRTARFLAAHGVDVPKTFSNDECASATDAGELLGYPFICKPRLGRGGRGVNVVVDASAAAAEKRTDVAYQEFLGGEEYDVNLFVYPPGVPLITRVMLKTGLKEGIVGNATGVRPAYRPDVAALADQTARVMMLEGPIDMDIRMTEGGLPRVIEVNARVGANVVQAGGILDILLRQSLAEVHA